MAKITESIKVECRNPEEYYELLDRYSMNGYKIEESDDSSCLDFLAIRNSKMWELEK